MTGETCEFLGTVMVVKFQRVQGGEWEYGVGIEHGDDILDWNGKVVQGVYDCRNLPSRGCFILYK